MLKTRLSLKNVNAEKNQSKRDSKTYWKLINLTKLTSLNIFGAIN